MKFFQIRFIRDKCGSFKYFETNDNDIEKKACEIANDFIEKQKENAKFRAFGYYEPIKILTVVEYDKVKKKAVRNGIKFKLRLTFVEAIYGKGNKVRNEWYEVK